jgi:hypothetical protein
VALAISLLLAGPLPPERAESATEGTPPPAAVYLLHLSAFMVYDALITDPMPLRLRTGVLLALLFTVAIGLHVVLTDRGLAQHYPRRFGARRRLALAAALVAD